MSISPTSVTAGGSALGALRCIVIDDDPLSCRILETHIAQTSDLELVTTLTNGQQLLDYLRTAPPVDVLFLDVEMPGLSGLEILALLPQRPAVVLTTSHLEFAADAFALQVMDYLAKPIEYPRFLQAVRRVRLRQPASPSTLASASAIAPSWQPEPRLTESLFLNIAGRLVRIPFADILYAEARSEETTIITLAQSYPTGYSLSELAAQLPPAQFAQVHTGYIVNRAMIEVVDETGNVILRGGHTVPIAPLYLREFLASLHE